MTKVLIVIPFYNIYPPMSGGMLRCFNLLLQLNRYFEVTALINQDLETFEKAYPIYPVLKNCKVISTRSRRKRRDIFSIIPSRFRSSIKFRVWNRSLFESADDNYISLYPDLKDILIREKFDCVVFEDMSILSLTRLVKRFISSIPLIYDAYNVNSILAEKPLQAGLISQKEFDRIKNIEENLFKNIPYIFACSEFDLDKLIKMNRGKIKGWVIPNGVQIPTDQDNTDDNSLLSSDILFCGALDYFPNEEGLIWFSEKVFPLIVTSIPKVRLVIVGKGDMSKELTTALNKPNIVNYGKVDTVSDYYAKARIAIVPLLSGSGTRLKLVEAMALRKPVVSTTDGAEGVNYENDESILIGDNAQEFATQVIRLMTDDTLWKGISGNAFDLVRREYDWNILGSKMADFINDLVDVKNSVV